MKQRLELIKYLEEYKDIYNLSYDSNNYLQLLVDSLKLEQEEEDESHS